MTSSMPNIESELGNLRESLFFASIDFVSGYWQLPLAEEPQPLHTFLTTKEFFIPILTFQGARNSGSNFQSRVEPCFRDVRYTLGVWLDVFAIISRKEAQFLK